MRRNNQRVSVFHDNRGQRSALRSKNLKQSNQVHLKMLPSVFKGVPDSLINGFQECFHPYFPISIIILIKVRRNNQRVSMFHDNKGQGSAQRSKDQQQESYPL